MEQTEQREPLSEGDIIQITDRNHPWFPALMIVSEVKSWGAQAYVIIPQSNDGSEAPSMAFIRPQNHQFSKVGEAALVMHAPS